ncbi:MAG: thioesterase family protein [Clostridia bacterium]|nr:thioesterase family protein [Clostridia bacterium]
MLEQGLTYTTTTTVTEEKTAKTMGSGTLEVFATPAMIALMEEAAYKAVQPHLEEGMGSVGTYLDVKHLAATPLGMTVRCEATLIEIDRRRLVFKVTAFDDSGVIGEGKHERFIVNNESFMAKTNAKNIR